MKKLPSVATGFQVAVFQTRPETHAACDGKQFSIGRKKCNVASGASRFSFIMNCHQQDFADVVVHYKTSGASRNRSSGVMATTFGSLASARTEFARHC